MSTKSTKQGNAAKGWFLTFPKAEITKEELLEECKRIGEVAEYVIAEEKHQDGTPHLHAFIKFEGRKRFTQMKFSKHGNYQVAKSWKAVEAYVKKGGDFIANIDTESALAKKGKKNKMLLEEDPVDLVERGEITLFQLKSLMQNRELYLGLKRQRDQVEEEDIPTEKKRHIWIWGGPDSGKTTKLESIYNQYPGNHFQIPYNNDWQGYKGERILWADEYKGQLSIQELNRICDGGAKVNTKGSTVTLHRKPQVIIASNYDPIGCYCKADSMIVETIKNRFNIQLYNYKDEL